MGDTKSLVKKYANKTPEEMVKEQEDLEEEVAIRSTSMEQAIHKYSSKTDEMKNPDTQEIMAVVKRPTAEQYRRTIPPQLAKFKDNPEDIPYELGVEYEDDLYELMSEMIVQPQHDAGWWRKNTGPEFMMIFQAHIVKVYWKLQEQANAFLEQA